MVSALPTPLLRERTAVGVSEVGSRAGVDRDHNHFFTRAKWQEKDTGMGAHDPAVLDRILRPGHLLSTADVLLLSQCLEPAWRVRRRRLEARNAAIRDARAFFPEEADWPAARAMERALAACVDARRRRRLAGLPPDPVAPGTRTEAVRRIADLNEGCELERRTIFNALREGAG